MPGSALLLLAVTLAAPPAAEPSELEIAIGQMLMVGFRGTSLPPEARILADLRQRYLGGVVLFNHDLMTGAVTRNIESPEQLARLVRQLREAARLPLLVAVDQEGGSVMRLGPAFGLHRRATDARTLGRRSDTEATRSHATKTAGTLGAFGINLNFAPVVDLDVDPESPAIGMHGRSYGNEVGRVVEHARAVIRAHHEVNLLCAIKHFPGHGSARADSHLGLVDVTATWSARELAPFAQLIRSGGVDAVMTAHLYNRKLDAELPASLSRHVIQGLLRDELGFEGVVISDDLQMGGLLTRFGLRQVVKLAILAGTDILVIANNSLYDEGVTAAVIAMVAEMVRRDEIPRALIDRAQERIRRLKERLPAQ